jgi:hypothetical protein
MDERTFKLMELQKAYRIMTQIRDKEIPLESVVDCVSPDRLDDLAKQVAGVPRLDVVKVHHLVIREDSSPRYGERRRDVYRTDLLPPSGQVPEGEEPCLAGLWMKVMVRTAGPEFVRWQGGIDGYKFTRRGLVDRLVQWVRETGGGRRIDFLVWSGKLQQRDQGGKRLYRSATSHGDWREAPGFRGHFSTFFGSAVDAGIVSIAPGGRLVAGPNLGSFLAGSLKHDTDVPLEVHAFFLPDDWVLVKVTDSRNISTDYKCDGDQGVLDLLSFLAEVVPMRR